MESQDNTRGTRMTCTDDDCSCLLEIIDPCPHGATYTCACGHPMEAVSAT